MTRLISRRSYLKSTAALAAGLTILPARSARAYAANEKVNIGIIGAGGRGSANLKGVGGEKAGDGENIVALCDVDRRQLDRAVEKFPAARKYTDFRKLLEEAKDLDAVVVSTPDHNHAPASIPAMRMGLHCYCEKPLTHDVHEALLMAQVAADKKLSTHMGTPSRGHEETVRSVEIIRSGALGDVTEAHFWTDRPIWAQGFDRPAGEDPLPESLDYECFIGSAPMRPFKAEWPENHPVKQSEWKHKQVYHPFVWRGWWDFGTGALGDIAPHQWSPAYWGLELTAPKKVEIVEMSGPVTDMFPAATTLCFTFPVPGKPDVKIFWYDGGNRPSPEKFGADRVPESGELIVGTKASLGSGKKNAGEFADVPRTLRRYGDMYEEWLAGIRQGDPDRPSCPFSYAGPLTAAYLMGNIAMKLRKTIEWDAAAGQVTNCREASQFLQREYRKGWGI
ncbi:MAG: Gfo/Idh/MocA family protein [Thermoguttaceae bacterium]